MRRNLRNKNNYVDISWKKIKGRWNYKCKGPVEIYLTQLRSNRVATVAGAE